MKLFSLATLFLCILSLSTYADEVTDKSTDVTFPKQVSFSHDGKNYSLQATGVATRKKFMVKVYSVASYVQDGTVNKTGDVFDQILQDDKAKQLTLKFVHEADVKRVQDGYRESFKTAVSDASRIQKDIDTYISFFNKDIQKGDEQQIRWAPGGYVEVIVNGNKVGSITNPEFAKGLWNIWFGPNSIVNRDNLVSMIKG